MKTTYIISRKKEDRTMAEKYRAERQKKRAFMVLSAGLVLVILIMCTFQLVQYKAYATEPKREYVTELPISYEAVTVQSEPEKTSLGEFKITHYCACSTCCGVWSDGYTSTGTKATANRTVAVDPAVIPYGTTLYIDGQVYTAEDCGGSIKGNRIDIYCDSHEEALQKGVKYTEVFEVNE